MLDYSSRLISFRFTQRWNKDSRCVCSFVNYTFIFKKSFKYLKKKNNQRKPQKTNLVLHIFSNKGLHHWNTWFLFVPVKKWSVFTFEWFRSTPHLRTYVSRREKALDCGCVWERASMVGAGVLCGGSGWWKVGVLGGWWKVGVLGGGGWKVQQQQYRRRQGSNTFKTIIRPIHATYQKEKSDGQATPARDDSKKKISCILFFFPLSSEFQKCPQISQQTHRGFIFF